MELIGDEAQPGNVDTLVDLRITHSGYSGFRADGENIKVFRQSQSVAWAARYDRLVHTDVTKCREARSNGQGNVTVLLLVEELNYAWGVPLKCQIIFLLTLYCSVL